jgi:hypothetical protein
VINRIITKNISAGLIILLVCSCNQYELGHVFLGMPSTKVESISFDNEPTDDQLLPVYPDPQTDPYLKELRETYPLDSLINSTQTDTEKALRLLEWTNMQWEHNGNNEPSRADALTILKEAQTGSMFRCVEYSIVSTDVLLALGMRARVVSLKTKDVETCKTGAGHVLTEVWLSDHNKWAVMDGQYNVMPLLNNIPLNAVEFQEAIVNKRPFQLVNRNGEISGRERKRYLQFIPHYLYFFDIRFDNRRNIDSEDTHLYKGKELLMLVPKGAKHPTVFQRKFAIGDAHYTNSIADFYRRPG